MHCVFISLRKIYQCTGFSLIRISRVRAEFKGLQCKSLDSVLKRENTGQRKPVYWHILCNA